MVKSSSIVSFLLFFIFIKPHFYYYSYYLGRLSDMISIFVLSLLFLNITDLKFNIRIRKYLILILLYFVSISIALFDASLNYNIGFKDFVDFIRPFTLFISLLLGYSLYKHKKYSVDTFIKFMIIIGIISGIVAFIESSFAPILYKIYSDSNHLTGNRPTGIFYDFAEYGAIQCLVLIATFIKYNEKKSMLYLLIMGFLAVSILISTSKAAIILLLLTISFIILFNLKKTKITLFKIFTIIIIIFIVVVSVINYIDSHEKLYNEFIAMLELSDNLPSVANRLNDMHNVMSMFQRYNLNSIIGYSALRNYPNLSYIEIASFSVLFRYGILGILIYYSLYYFLFKEKISQEYGYFKILILSIVIVDMVAAMTNRFGLFIMLNLLFGLLIAEGIQKRRLNNENFIYKY